MALDSSSITSITISQCSIKKFKFVSPRIKVHLVDINSGLCPAGVKPATSSTCQFSDGSHHYIYWNETLKIDVPVQTLLTDKNKYLFLFEINDYVRESVYISLHPGRKSSSDRKRIAWAFVKPLSDKDDISYIGEELKLQLFKIRKSCSESHENCNLFHLYSEHKRKKLLGGILHVTIQEFDSNQLPSQEEVKEENITDNTTNVSEEYRRDSVKLSNLNLNSDIQLAEWYRLPTQSCKIPNAHWRDFQVSRQGASCVKFSHKGSHVACGSISKIAVYNVFNSDEWASFIGHSGIVYEIDWSSDDSNLLSASADGTCIVWGVMPVVKAPLHVLPHPSYVYCGRWLHESVLLATGCVDRGLRIWSKSEQDFQLVSEIIGHTGFVSALEVVSERCLITGDSSGRLYIWNDTPTDSWTNTRQINLKETVDSVIDGIHLHPGQRRIVVSARGCGAYMVDLNAAVSCHKYSAPVNCFVRSTSALSPCGNLLFSFAQNNVVYVWDFETARHIATYNNMLPVIGQTAVELSGHIHYHPRAHMAVFAFFGVHYPVKIVRYDKQGNNGAIDLICEEKVVESLEHVKSGQSLLLRKGDSSAEEKLAAVVLEMDRILAAKKEFVRSFRKE